MIRRPPRSTLDRSSAASDVYKRQGGNRNPLARHRQDRRETADAAAGPAEGSGGCDLVPLLGPGAVSYTHLRAHETVLDIVCRLLLVKKKKNKTKQTKTNKQNTTT